MHFKKFYSDVKGNLRKVVDGDKMVFTHGKFHGWEFEIKARKVK